MTSSTFVSEPPGDPSSAFSLLHPQLRRWVHEQRWTALHDAQERAVEPILAGDCDVLIAAPTSAGKTEAAFLPILSDLAWKTEQQNEPSAASQMGVHTLYVSPLKALINDQHDRLELLCGRIGTNVHRWHGDVASSRKKQLMDNPSGVLQITPESLEAIFVNRGSQVPRLLHGLSYLVVDEMHAFMGTERGAQLQSLMHRVDLSVRRRVPRIGLSATLSDTGVAANFLRPGDSSQVTAVDAGDEGQQVRIQLRGYVALPPAMSSKEASQAITEVTLEDTETADRLAIASDIFGLLRGSDNLVFANARRDVEVYADLLTRRCDQRQVPHEFWPHHGSLSKDMREAAEDYLKDASKPATAICTSTLEMGIDIGTAASVAQIGPPPSVAALRQRLGRSGRRGDPPMLRMFTSEQPIDIRSSIVDELRCQIVQSAAMVRLMLGRWLEDPDDPGYNYSTLVQQILSVIAQHGGASAADLYRALCGPGPFTLVDKSRFVQLLRAMADKDLVIQASDGLLLHGQVGERHVNHYEFYAAFKTAEEWRLVSGSKTLGAVPISHPLWTGATLIFGGRRWTVTDLDLSKRVVHLERSSGGTPPNFGGNAALVSNGVRKEMAAVYRSDETPSWLDETARSLLAEGRDAFRRYRLDRTTVIDQGTGILLIPWAGDKAMFTATMALLSEGIEAAVAGPVIELPGTGRNKAATAITRLLDSDPPTAASLASLIENPEAEKWDWALSSELAQEAAGARSLDIPGAWEMLACLMPALTSERGRAIC